MILIIDNYDSFVYNIAQYLYELGQELVVHRNDEITISEIEKLGPSHIIISPGPKTPRDAGISKDVIKHFAGKIPVLGICLGHEAIGEVFGAKVVHAKELVHGKIANVSHDGKSIFSGVHNPFTATRYHSLALARENFPECLQITATSDDKEIMAIKHKEFKVFGVQFHPESILTDVGKKVLNNFLTGAGGGVLFKDVLNKVVTGVDLDRAEAEMTMNMLMDGEFTDAQIGGLITALRMKGETTDEITAFANVMRDKALRLRLDDLPIVDTCGTGGDSKGTFNISTASAIVAAASGAYVAKHGNRAISSKSGSADLLKNLGVDISMEPKKVEASIREIGIGFMFAPLYHKAMKHAIGPRRELGIRTIFNILGPMSNPAHAKYQVMGVFSQDLTEKLARALGELGCEHAFVVSSLDGLDEISLAAKTKISEFVDGDVNTYYVDPAEYGFSYCKLEYLRVSNVEESTDAILKILKGEKGARRDIVVFNTAFVLVACGVSKTVEHGIMLASQTIDSGKALEKLNQMIGFSREK